MEDQLITFETAKLAKEKGFSLDVDFYYNSKKELSDGITAGYEINHRSSKEDYNTELHTYSAPTQSLLQRWLREIYNLNIEINKEKEDLFFGFINNIIKKQISQGNTYEEALEKGLQKALTFI